MFKLLHQSLIGGGTWSHIELTKYLVSVLPNLSPAELSRLTNTAWLLKRPHLPSGFTPKRYLASSLYEPTDALQELGLEILDWTTPSSAKTAVKWRSTSEEAKFLFSLGLKTFPPISDILQIAATDGPYRTNAFAYFMNEYDRYSTVYDPASHQQLAFVPVTSSNGKILYFKAIEVFSNVDCKVMGFKTYGGTVLEASKLKLATDPSAALLFERLLESPPRDSSEALQVFSYLSTQASRKSFFSLYRGSDRSLGIKIPTRFHIVSIINTQIIFDYSSKVTLRFLDHVDSRNDILLRIGFSSTSWASNSIHYAILRHQ